MQQAQARIAFRIDPDPSVCRSVRESVAKFATSNGVTLDDLDQFRTALGEAIANAIEHARSSGPIDVEIGVGADRIVGTVRDGGIGFDADPPEPAHVPGVIAERGRGFPIMRRCSDIFGVHSEPGRGTVVIVGRYLRPSQRDATARGSSPAA